MNSSEMQTLTTIVRRNLAVSIAGLVLLVASGCSSENKSGNEKEKNDAEPGISELTADQIAANELELGEPTAYAFSRVVTASGYLEALPQNRHSISAPMGGTIRELILLPGDRVQRGAILFRIWNPELLQIQEDYLTASSMLKFQQDDYERQKKLASENISAQKVFLKAESEYLGTQARVFALEARLALLHIDKEQLREGRIVSSVAVTAPISGFVARVEANNGKFVNPESPVMEIVETSPLMLSLQVFEKDIAHVREGQVVRFRIPEVTGEVFEAKVAKTGKTLDENRTVNIHAMYTPAAGLRLVPGMFVKAEIITESFTAMALPPGAIVSGDDFSFVLVKTNVDQASPGDGWKLKKVAVVKGYQDEKMVEILPGSKLALTDKVVVSGAFSVAK